MSGMKSAIISGIAAHAAAAAHHGLAVELDVAVTAAWPQGRPRHRRS